MKILINDKSFEKPIKIKYYERSHSRREIIKRWSESSLESVKKMNLCLPRLNFEFPMEHFDTLATMTYLNLELDSRHSTLIIEKIENNRIFGIVLEDLPLSFWKRVRIGQTEDFSIAEIFESVQILKRTKTHKKYRSVHHW